MAPSTNGPRAAALTGLGLLSPLHAAFAAEVRFEFRPSDDLGDLVDFEAVKALLAETPETCRATVDGAPVGQDVIERVRDQANVERADIPRLVPLMAALTRCPAIELESGRVRVDPRLGRTSIRLVAVKVSPVAGVETLERARAIASFDQAGTAEEGLCHEAGVTCWTAVADPASGFDPGIEPGDVLFVWASNGEEESLREVTEPAEGSSSMLPATFEIASATKGGAPLSGLLDLAPAIDQTSILVGLTDFLMDRAETETRAWLVEQELEHLCTDSGNPARLDAKRLLPGTCALLDKGSVAMAVASPGVLLTTARDDLASLPRHLAEWSAESDPEPRARDRARVVGATSRVAELVLDGAAPGDALASWAKATDREALRDLLAAGAETADVYPWTTGTELTLALFATSVLLAGIPADEVTGRLRPPEDLGADLPYLLVAAEHNLRTRGLLEGDGRYWLTVPALERAARRLLDEGNGLLARADRLLVRARELDAAVLAGPTPDARKQALLLLAEVAGLGAEMSGTVEVLVRERMEAFPADDARRVALLEEAKAVVALLDRLEALAEALAAADYASAVVEVVALAREAGIAVGELPESVQRSLAFAAALAQVSDADGARAALESWAAPVGGFKRKHRPKRGYWGLNGYVGLRGGWEGEGSPSPVAPYTSAALAPLVGVGAEAGLSPCKKLPFYLGLHVPLLDLGAIATWRVEQEDDVETQEFTFVQFFSPGLFFVVAPWDAPFALGVGSKVLPEVREVGGTDSAGGTWWYSGGFVAVDVPLFP